MSKIFGNGFDESCSFEEEGDRIISSSCRSISFEFVIGFFGNLIFKENLVYRIDFDEVIESNSGLDILIMVE